jgi:hypothetical protein
VGAKLNSLAGEVQRRDINDLKNREADAVGILPFSTVAAPTVTAIRPPLAFLWLLLLVLCTSRPLLS